MKFTLKNCDYDDCLATGEYKAPKSRCPKDGYFYFCFEHIKLYNRSWDYFKGMSEEEIVAHRISDITWRRPTWSYNQVAKAFKYIMEHPLFDEPMGIILDHTALKKPQLNRHSKEFKAMNVLEISYPFSEESLKKRYFYLVKQYHPDKNAGCKASEEKLKRITVAYKLLATYLKHTSSC